MNQFAFALAPLMTAYVVAFALFALMLFVMLFAGRKPVRRGRLVPGRYKVRDIAIKFRMAAGFPGDVNRSHPANIEPCLIDAANPPTLYGQAVVGDAASQGVRPFLVTDAVAAVYGITVRAYPVSQTTGGMAASIGSAGSPGTGVADVLKQGYVLVQVSGGGTPAKFTPVYIWIAASVGNHVLGGFEAVANGANTAILPGAMWNGGPDASGVAEVILGV